MSNKKTDKKIKYMDGYNKAVRAITLINDTVFTTALDKLNSKQLRDATKMMPLMLIKSTGRFLLKHNEAVSGRRIKYFDGLDYDTEFKELSDSDKDTAKRLFDATTKLLAKTEVRDKVWEHVETMLKCYCLYIN